MLDLPPATLDTRATHDPCRNLADYALCEAVRAPDHIPPMVGRGWIGGKNVRSQAHDLGPELADFGTTAYWSSSADSCPSPSV